MKFSKAIDLEDFFNNALSPYLQKIAKIEMGILGIDEPQVIPDSKNWETAMALYSFESFNLLKPGKVFAGIGAGTELLTELLADYETIVFPVDRYLEDTPWSDVAPGGYMVDPLIYTQFYKQAGHIIPVHSDARALNLPSNFFDGVYSSGSIEHFGGLESVEAAAAEIGRILKPGGFASISTEFWLNGPEGKGWFDDNCILFTPNMIEKHIVRPSGLSLIDVPDNLPSEKTFETRKVLVDFLKSAKNIKTLDDKLSAYPNLVLFHEGFLFCSVHILLKKPLDIEASGHKPAKAISFNDKIRSNNLLSIKRLEDRIKSSIDTAHNDMDNPEITRDKTKERGSRSSKILKFCRSLVEKSPTLKGFLLRVLIKLPNLSAWLRRRS